MQIKRAIERVPGGMMTVPLLAGAALTTFAPHAAPYFGSFTNALFNGALPILAVFYVCMGSRISVSSLPLIIRKGGALMLTKVALGILAALVLGHFLGVAPV